MTLFGKLAVVLSVIGAVTSCGWALDGDALVLKSNGNDVGTSWRINDNGYVGTFIDLAAPGPVTLRVNAQGAGFGGIDPRMNIVIDDSVMGWDVGGSASDYEYTVDLPAGMHFVRTEFNNEGGTSRTLTVNSFEVVSGATLRNEVAFGAVGVNAMAAANNYIANYRKGDATVHMPALEQGTQVQVKLKSHAFNFGVGVPSSGFLANPVPGGTPALFQQALVDNRFNSLTPQNQGKWGTHEATRDAQNMTAIDATTAFTQSHDMGFRQHNLLWGPNDQTGGNNTQPNWAYNMLQNPTGIDGVSGMTNAEALRAEISERIQYYIADRAQTMYEVDVYNESFHTGSNNGTTATTYWDVYGVDGIAGIYKEVKDALAEGGGDGLTFVNEYNVISSNNDMFANWYARHIESLQNAGQALYGENVVGGIGVQYYNNGGGDAYNAQRIYQTLQNLSVQGLPISLTEFGVSGDPSDPVRETNAASVLVNTARLVFGTAAMEGFTQWDLRATPGAFAGVGSLYNNDWTLRQTGVAWQALMDEWDTDLMLEVGEDGTINFNGFYGDFELTIGSETYDFTLTKGDEDYIIHDLTIQGDTDGDGDVDISDFIAVKNNLGSLNPGLTGGDADGDGDVDNDDLTLVKSNYGAVVTPGPPGLTFIPEPASAGLFFVSGLTLLGRRWARIFQAVAELPTAPRLRGVYTDCRPKLQQKCPPLSS